MALSDKVPQSTSLNSWEYSLINNPDYHFKEFLKTPSPRKKLPNCFPQRLRGICKENYENQRDSISLLRTNSCPSDIKTDVNHSKNKGNISSFINSKNVNSVIDNGLQVLNDTSRKRKHLHDKWTFRREDFNEPHFQSSLKTLIEDSGTFDDKARVQFLIGNMINGINDSIKRELADGTLHASTPITNVILPSNKINTNKSMQSILNKKSKKCCIANFKNKPPYLYSQMIRSKIKSYTNEHSEIFKSIKTPIDSVPCTQVNSNIVHTDNSKFYAIPLGIPQLQTTPFLQYQLPHVSEIKSSKKEHHSKVNEEIDRKEEIKRNLIIQKLPAVSIEPIRKKTQVDNTQVVTSISNDNENFPKNQMFHNPIEMLPHTKYNQENYPKEGEHHFRYEALSDPVHKHENYLRDRKYYPHNIVSHGSLNETYYNGLDQELKQKKNIEVQVTDWIEAELLSRILNELQLQQTDSTIKNNDTKKETNIEPPVAHTSNFEPVNDITDKLDFNNEFPKEIHLPLEDIDNIPTPAPSPTQSISFLSPATPNLSQSSDSNQDKHLTHNLTLVEEIPELVEYSFDVSRPVTPALSEKLNSEADFIPDIKTLSLSEECVIGSLEDLKLPNKKAAEESYKSPELLENDNQEIAQKSLETVSETYLTKEQGNEPRSLNNKIPSEEPSSQSYADLSDGDIHSVGQFLHDERSLGVSKNSLLNELMDSEEFSNLDNSEVGLSEGEIGLNNLSAINSILEGINKLKSQTVDALPTYISRNDISVGEILTSDQRCVVSDFDDDSLSLGEVITNVSACKRFKFKSVENMHQNAEWRNKFKILVKTDDHNSKVLEPQNNEKIKHFNDNVKPVPKPRQKIKKFTLPSSPNEVPINRTEKSDDRNQLIVSMEPLAINKVDDKIDYDQSDNSEKAIADDTIYDVSEISLNENL